MFAKLDNLCFLNIYNWWGLMILKYESLVLFFYFLRFWARLLVLLRTCTGWILGNRDTMIFQSIRTMTECTAIGGQHGGIAVRTADSQQEDPNFKMQVLAWGLSVWPFLHVCVGFLQTQSNKLGCLSWLQTRLPLKKRFLMSVGFAWFNNI